MADLRIFSYLPNPRLYKATIAARFSGAEIEIIGAKPKELPGWLWDYDARELTEADQETKAQWVRTARAGFSGELYKTDAFLKANPYGDVPAAFGDGGRVGIFESNSIMRAAAKLGPNAGGLCGDTPLQQARIDGFLDRSLVFARDLQRYLLAGKALAEPLHDELAAAFESWISGIEQALSTSTFIASDAISLADIAFACEACQLSNEVYMEEALAAAGLEPLLPRIADYPRARAHLAKLGEDPHFAEDLERYYERLPLA